MALIKHLRILKWFFFQCSIYRP